MSRITLTHGETVLELDPRAGGSVSALRHRDLEILRPAPSRTDGPFDARDYGAFPMLPFVGRIYNGEFQFNGASIQLPANMRPEPHAIHGQGWQTAWRTEALTETTATLLCQHSAETWPWSYEAKQSFQVHPDGLSVSLRLENLSEDVMPGGIGWHPYFHRATATLRINTTSVWALNDFTGALSHASVTSSTDLSEGRAVESLILDTTYSVGSHRIKLTWPTHDVIIESDPIFLGATVYIPPAEDFFCVEPVSQVPNAINSALPRSETGLKLINPGETLEGSISLKVIR